MSEDFEIFGCLPQAWWYWATWEPEVAREFFCLGDLMNQSPFKMIFPFRIRYFFNCMLQRYPHRNFDFVKETMPQRCCQYSSNCSAVPFDCVFMWIVFISSSKNSLPTETSIAINVMCTRNNCGPWKRNYFKSILERNADAECKNNLICLPFFISASFD